MDDIIGHSLGDVESSRVLIDHGANVNTRMIHHATPLHLSVLNGHFRLVKMLIERGADANALNAYGESPYQLSLGRGFREIADLLR